MHRLVCTFVIRIQQTQAFSHRSPFITVLFVGYSQTILNKSENATLQLSIFYEKVLDKKYLLKLNNVAQTSSKRFVETPAICLV